MKKSVLENRIRNLADDIKDDEKKLIQLVFEYAKMEGLVPVSKETSEGMDYKKILKEEFNLII